VFRVKATLRQADRRDAREAAGDLGALPRRAWASLARADAAQVYRRIARHDAAAESQELAQSVARIPALGGRSELDRRRPDAWHSHHATEVGRPSHMDGS